MSGVIRKIIRTRTIKFLDERSPSIGTIRRRDHERIMPTREVHKSFNISCQFSYLSIEQVWILHLAEPLSLIIQSLIHDPGVNFRERIPESVTPLKLHQIENLFIIDAENSVFKTRSFLGGIEEPNHFVSESNDFLLNLIPLL